MDKKIILGLIAIIILLVAISAYFSSQQIPTFNITNNSTSDDNSNYQIKDTSKNTTNKSENSSTTKTICKDCNGKGYFICSVCNGTGIVNGQICLGGQNECDNGRSKCYSCDGDGYFEPAKGDSYTID